MEYYRCARLFPLCGFYRVGSVPRGFPARRFCFSRFFGDDGYFVRHHEAGVKTHAELSDQILIGRVFSAFQCLQVLFRPAFGDGSQKSNEIVRTHPNAVIGECQRVRFLIRLNLNGRFSVYFQRGVGERLNTPLVKSV